MSTASIAAAIDRTRSRRARTTEAAPTGSAVAYLRVSTDEQAESGAGLAAQRNAIEAVAAVRGWTITAWHEDGGVSGGKAPHQRPGLAGALDAVQTGQAERLIVAKIDRLSRRFRDAVDLMETAADEGWPLYIADIDADLTTSNGRLVARMTAVAAMANPVPTRVRASPLSHPNREARSDMICQREGSIRRLCLLACWQAWLLACRRPWAWGSDRSTR